jgi:hypothetical protein
MPGFNPQNARASPGCRYWSRDLSASLRVGAFTAATIALSVVVELDWGDATVGVSPCLEQAAINNPEQAARETAKTRIVDMKHLYLPWRHGFAGLRV